MDKNLTLADIDAAIKLAMVLTMRAIKDKKTTIEIPTLVLAALNAAACMTAAEMETHGIDELTERGYGKGETQ